MVAWIRVVTQVINRFAFIHILVVVSTVFVIGFDMEVRKNIYEQA